MTTFLKLTKTIAILVLALFPSYAQRRPEVAYSPDPGPGRVEVRFAIGKRSVNCRMFSIEVKRDDKTLVKGEFLSGFQLPVEESKTSIRRELEVRIGCGKNQWHFSRVPDKALLQGWWWIGTDYPPFQAEFSGDRFAKCRSIRYMTVDPTNQMGFDYFETTPITLDGSRVACTGS